MKKDVMFLECLTPLHAGSGFDTGIVDKPIQREKVTFYPKIEASTLKGSIRSVLEEKIAEILFGSEGRKNSHYKPGILSLTDSKTLFFPVKSIKGIYGLVTCPKVLQRFIEDIEGLDFSQNSFIKIVKYLGNNEIYIPEDTCYTLDDELSFSNTPNGEEIIILDEFMFYKENIDCKLYENLKEKKQKKDNDKKILSLLKRLIIVSNDDFEEFVTNHTEVITRIEIDDETGTTTDKGLFTEEYLPPYSIVYTILLEFEDLKNVQGENFTMDDIVNCINNIGVVQVGGNKSLGKGLLKINFYKE